MTPRARFAIRLRRLRRLLVRGYETTMLALLLALAVASLAPAGAGRSCPGRTRRSGSLAKIPFA